MKQDCMTPSLTSQHYGYYFQGENLQGAYSYYKKTTPRTNDLLAANAAKNLRGVLGKLALTAYNVI